LAEVELEWCGPMAEGLRWAADLQARYLEEPVQLLRSFLRQERERRAGGASAAKAGSHGCSPVASADAAAGEGAVAGRQGSVLSRCMPSFVLNVFVLCVRERRCVCVRERVRVCARACVRACVRAYVRACMRVREPAFVCMVWVCVLSARRHHCSLVAEV